jgi:hypothetical protein
MRIQLTKSVYLLLLLFPLLVCCSSSKTASNEKEKSILQRQLVAQISKLETSGDALTILSVDVKGNNLIVRISYSGGCGTHDFECHGNKAISKSLPPQRTVRLIHKANGDQCKKLIEEELIIDIKGLAYQAVQGSEIVLQVEGWKESIHYIYQ